MVQLSDDLPADALATLIKLGLRHSAPDAIARYEQAVADLRESTKNTLSKELNAMRIRVDSESAALTMALREYLENDVLERFP